MPALPEAQSPAERALGLAMVAFASVVFALSGILTKSIDADFMVIVCWRGLIGFVLVGFYVAWRARGDRSALVLGRRGWLVVFVSTIASITFISSFKYAYVANVTIIYATIPLAAAVLGWLMLGEGMRRRTFVAAMVSLAGVLMMVGAGVGEGNVLGDALALAMTCLSALYVVMIRKYRETPVVWAGAVSALVLFGLGWIFTDPLALHAADVLLVLGFGFSYAVAIILWTEGAKLIPAAETGLLGLLEVPVGVSLAWLFLAEVPPLATLAGGLVVLAAVVWHTGRDWLDSRRREAMAA